MNTTDTEAILNISAQCWGEYTTFILGAMLFISEVLPFYQRKCVNDVEVVDVEGNVGPIDKQPSILHNSNGLLHSGISLYRILKKK
jgi:hypothetical protein